MNDFIKAFGELTMKDIPLVGGKGANLGELMRSDFPVPPVFVSQRKHTVILPLKRDSPNCTGQYLIAVLPIRKTLPYNPA